jgi:hypothetical protein
MGAVMKIPRDDGLNAFRGIFLGTLLGIILWVIIAWVLWMIIGPRTQAPYAMPQPRTQSEQREVERAIKGIGRHVIIDGEREIEIVMENGKKRIIGRRAL